MLRKVLQAVLIFSLSLFAAASYALPLSTRSRWIVDSTSGNRVKLKCINWAAHMQTMLAEGLDKKPLSDVASQVSSLGFNCVRLTWATFMFTRPEYSNLGVAESLKTLGLVEAMRGLEENNPSFMNLTVLEAYVAVVDVLGKHELMVVVDNHVSMPMWCCRDNDGNGFFGDRFFTPREWLKGLIMVAKQFKGKKQVVGMSLRNELRGPHQNLLGWYRYLKYAARRIHDENPHVLVILGGLNYCTRLDFLKKRPFGGNLDNKLVYEAHWYSFTGGDRQKWKVNTLSQVCDKTTQAFNNLAVFVTKGEKPVPLFLSEFGVDERGTDQADNRFLSCFLAFATENDMDWAIWALQGTYYLKNGHPEFDETYGVLDGTWNHLRNPNFRERFQLMQQTLQDPTSNDLTYLILYHPQSSRCIRTTSNNIYASDCWRPSQWNHNGDGTALRLIGTDLCIQVVGDGLPAALSSDCSSKQSTWNVASSSRLYLSALDQGGRLLCLEMNYTNPYKIMTNTCICLGDGSVCDRDPQSQWFKLISTNFKY